MRRFKNVAAAIALAGVWLTAPAVAQVESKCLSSQLKASGAYAAAQAKCESKGAAKGEAVDPACLAKALEKATKALANAEKKDDCIETGRTPFVDEAVEEFVEEISRILNPPPVVCCAFATDLCVHTADAAECTALPFSGTPGAEGTVCSGDGSCVAPAEATTGNCCEDFSAKGADIDCLVGPSFDETDCNSVGGTFSTGVCTPSGLCE